MTIAELRPGLRVEYDSREDFGAWIPAKIEQVSPPHGGVAWLRFDDGSTGMTWNIARLRPVSEDDPGAGERLVHIDGSPADEALCS